MARYASLCLISPSFLPAVQKQKKKYNQKLKKPSGDASERHVLVAVADAVKHTGAVALQQTHTAHTMEVQDKSV